MEGLVYKWSVISSQLIFSYIEIPLYLDCKQVHVIYFQLTPTIILQSICFHPG